ncbi:carbohydrate ABC transporter permease [Paenibacillus sp. N3.4]|uniref:carbohydrate ABC transporter permease n=1 Tax=Paenibacillus sp. N3.4 TaxID=2603222 RepID=UPI0011CBB372|nr:sugar ABC transporter permease [Paenibacillus sp. N3.4]TXK82607.1 sugar ABC transporter permease [Paenibacillus sp. N3.4]
MKNEISAPRIDLQAVKKSKKARRWETPFTGYLFLTPWLIGIICLTLWPMLQSLYYAFTDYSILDKPHWLGLDNFRTILSEDDTFLQSLKVTLWFVVISVPLKLAFALLVAILLKKDIKGMKAYRTMIYLPSLIGTSVAVAVLWRNIFGDDGIINQALKVVGIQGKAWISDPSTALGTLVILVVWQFGSSMVIFLAGLKQIPNELYEAAEVDGASKVRQFFSITFPMLSPIILFNLVLQTIGSFQTFTQAFVITRGGPVHSTHVYAMYLYERAFDRMQMGYASALAWILLIIIAVATGLLFASSKFWVFYETESGGKSK